MIPRRRIYIDHNDFIEWLKAPFYSRASDMEDIRKFERSFSSFLKIPHAMAAGSGRDAILLALRAVGAKKSDEIIVPAYTLGELITLLENSGLIPVPADIEPDTFNIDIKDLKKRVTKRTKAILATHLLGAPCNITEICRIARENGIFVVEDCAHSLGASVGEKQVGTFGDIGTFSFEVNKPVSTYGGGMLVTGHDYLAQKISDLLASRQPARSASMKRALSAWTEELIIRSPAYGLIAKVIFSEKFAKTFERYYRGTHEGQRNRVLYSGFQARVGIKRLKRLAARNRRMNIMWNSLAEKFPKLFTIQKREKAGSPAFYNFVALSPCNPVAVREAARFSGIDIGIGSEVMDDCSSMLSFKCPVAENTFNRAILVPLYESMKETEFEKIVSAFEYISANIR